ncbi:uncharacterized protein LOC112268944 [Brachypodium distachyon]|uniref:uncharacterized protein LOC112268944 n=1 Tax=Brachypodium distachyon TaxID=15368 RepID=UPI000D0CDC6C|nr:uncharacterized protein LOC112268944 [Brachypodium distachyon]|eukprot:XP_024311054.1 uncharacterized protein LOC112268944 [Brachypodium distachyon]
MNKRLGAFKGLLGMYKKLEASHEALKVERESQTRDNAQVEELLKCVSELQDEKTRLAEQHQKEISQLQAEITAQAKAHKTEVNQLTSALSAREDEKTRLEDEVKKSREAVAALETRGTVAELEDAEKAGLINALQRDIIKIYTMLTKFFPLSVKHAEATVTKARKKRDLEVAAGAPFEWDLEDHLVSIACRVKPLKSFGIDMVDACLQLFKALWPGEEVPVEIPDLARRLSEGPTCWMSGENLLHVSEPTRLCRSYSSGTAALTSMCSRLCTPTPVISRTRSWWLSAGKGHIPSYHMPTCISL